MSRSVSSVVSPQSARHQLCKYVPGAKRIGLMFSEAALDWTLDPKYTEDIDDLKTADGQKEFSDGEP
jgi:hypothetical protein